MTDVRKIDLILLVDDDNIVNFLNTTIIKHTNRVEEIYSVTSAIAALDKLNEFKEAGRWPSIICVDINMPGVNGWEFIELLKEQFAAFKDRSLVCILSSSLDPRDEAKAEQSEWINQYLSKPLTSQGIHELCNKVQV